MNRKQKQQAIDALAEAVAKCSAGVFTDYKGLPVAEQIALRRRLSKLGIEYRVVKNTLARFAVKKAGRDFLAASFEGPVAIAFGYGDVMAPAKALVEYSRSSDSTLGIRGGFLADRLLTPEEVQALAIIPPREVLLAQVAAGMQAPIVALLNCFASPLRDITGILKARIKQLEVE